MAVFTSAAPAAVAATAATATALPSPADVTERHEVIDLLDRALGTLSQREESILRLRYGLDDEDPLTLADTANQLGVTKERIRQQEAGAFRHLRGESKRVRTDAVKTRRALHDAVVGEPAS